METNMIYRFKITAILVFFILLGAGTAQAQQAPHTSGGGGVNCENCHFLDFSGSPIFKAPWPDDIDGVGRNQTCWNCHNEVVVPFKETHGSNALGNKYVGGVFEVPVIGGWTVQCVNCHNKHDHTQNTPLDSGTVSSASAHDVDFNTTVITVAPASWTAGQWEKYIVELGTVRYMIQGNGTNTLTVQGDASNKGSTTYNIYFGRFINSSIDTTGNGSQNMPITFADSPADWYHGDGTGICEVCHTAAGQGAHPADQAANDCRVCHNTFAGFKQSGDCNACHGQSGDTGAPLVPNDMETTSGRPVGAHRRHVVELGFTECGLCHSGYSMPESPPEMTVSFSGIAAGGTYDGLTYQTPDDSWTYNPPWPTITPGQDCTNLYCHSDGRNNYRTVDWGGSLPDSAECDSCHGGDRNSTDTAGGEGPMSSGKHSAHINNFDSGLGSFPCGRCHADTVTTGDDRAITGSKHVSGAPDLVFDTLNAGAPDCSSLYCHSDGKGTSVPPPGTNTSSAMSASTVKAVAANLFLS